ncbi:MAG: hypothetical protein DRO23_01215 [Thermoprotei archaeon]|nr:MAG: hypothetical protein DRO23_01215 [Thermoprotei archaeon]
MLSLAKLLQLTGLSATAALVLAILIIEERPLSLKELSEKTGYAKGHLSSILQFLESRKLIEKAYEKRRKLLVKVKKKAISNLLKEHLSMLSEIIQETIKEIRKDVLVTELKPFEVELMKMLKVLR